MSFLTEEQLFKQVPSIFSTTAHKKVSAKYAVIPTIECVRGLQQAGFYPVKAQENRCRDSENQPYTKHLIRFRREGTNQSAGNFPEVILINSHNGLSSYQLKAGIYRQVCSNGLIVGNDLYNRSVRHQGNVIEKVVASANEIIEVVPEILEISNEWRSTPLNNEQRKIYAESAAMLKWDEEKSLVNPEKLLIPKRRADTDTDLWTTFNVIQENIIRGGIRYYNSDNHRRGSTREVRSVSENCRLNMALWNLTEKMAMLAK